MMKDVASQCYSNVGMTCYHESVVTYGYLWFGAKLA
jgi:hypothetical protein